MGHPDTAPTTATLSGAPAPPDATAMALPSWLSYSAFSTAMTTRTLTTSHLLVFPEDLSRGPSEKTQTKTRTYATTERSIVYRPLEYTGPLPGPPLGTLFTLPGDQASASTSSAHTHTQPTSRKSSASSHEGPHISSRPVTKTRHSSIPTARPDEGSTQHGGFGGAKSSHSGRHSSSHEDHSLSSDHSLSRPIVSTDQAKHGKTGSNSGRSGSHTSSGRSSSGHRTSSTKGRHSAYDSSTVSHKHHSSKSYGSSSPTEQSSGRRTGTSKTRTAAQSHAGSSASGGSHGETEVPSSTGSTRPATETPSSKPSEEHRSSSRNKSLSETSTQNQGKGTQSANRSGSAVDQPSFSASHSSSASTSRGRSGEKGPFSSTPRGGSLTDSPPLLSGQSSGDRSSAASAPPDQTLHTVTSSAWSSTSTRSSASLSSSSAVHTSSTSTSSSPTSVPAKSFTSSLSTDFPFLPSTSPSPTTGTAKPFSSGNKGLSNHASHGMDGGSNKLSTGQIVGIAVGSFFGALAILALITLVAWLCYRRRRRQRDPYGLEDRYTKSGLTAAEKMEAGDSERPQGLAGRFFALRSGGKGAYAAVGNAPGRGYSINSSAPNQSMSMIAGAPSAGGHDTTPGSLSAFLSSTGPRYPNGSASRSTGLTDRYASSGAGRAGVGAFVTGMAGRRQSSKRYASETHDEDTNLLEHNPSHTRSADAHHASELQGEDREPLMEGAHAPYATDGQNWMSQSEVRDFSRADVATKSGADAFTSVPGWNEAANVRRLPLHREGTQRTAGADTAVTSLTRETAPSTISSQSLFTAPSRDNSRSHRPSQQLLFARLSSRPGINGPIAELDGTEADSPSTFEPAGVMGAGAAYAANSAIAPCPEETNHAGMREQHDMLGVPGPANVGDTTLTPSVNTASSHEDDGNVLWDGKRHSPEARLAALERTSPGGSTGALHTDGREGNTTGSQTSLSSMATHDGRTDASTYPRTMGSSSSNRTYTDQPSTAAQAGDSDGSAPDSASTSNSLGINLGSPAASAADGAFPSGQGREPDSDYPISSTTSAPGYDPSLLSSMGYGSSEYGSRCGPASSLATMGTSRRSRSSGVPTASSSGPPRSYASPLSNSPSLPPSQTGGAPPAPVAQGPPGLVKSLPTAPEQTYDAPTYGADQAMGQDPYADDEEQSREHLLHPTMPDLEETKWDTAGEYRYGEPLADIEERSLERSSQAGLSGRGSRMGALSRQPTGTTGRGSLASTHASGWDDYATPHQPVWRPSPRVRTATQKAIGRLNQHEPAQHG